MVQTRIEERMELIDREIDGMKKEMSKIHAIELGLIKITKNLELVRLQSEKQQQVILRLMEMTEKERSMMSERLSESMSRESLATSTKENKPFISRKIDSEKADKKFDTEDNNGDQNKFKKVEMPVFNGEDPDSWLFRAERYFQIHKLSESEKMLVENKEIIRGEANLNGYAVGKYQPNSGGISKSAGDTSVIENKGNTTFTIRTTALRGSNANEVEREGTFKRLPDVELQARKEKGLCFKCNDKYSTDHKWTMKVRGKLQNEEVIVLIDCGATHNFIFEKLLKLLQLSTKETPHYGVILGSRQSKEKEFAKG
ncbi:histone-lysine N-methyltransferase ASHR1 isoform X3 [Cucumis melo var. makuwa]|uniref:Histone-lysine N-methyltransferase ASHR1 isoform X3 n=1 Tax=Cucumis melo var. makuwa TaxID=1194695 RepID=A0A5A7V7F9_CUCMM|nr:histone-lysine N-methyltransferase ASHR1 isoform X3 [Cucumis melo var. makuwa]